MTHRYWIPVEESLPRLFDIVLVRVDPECYPTPIAEEIRAYHNGDFFVLEDDPRYILDDVTHWCEIP